MSRTKLLGDFAALLGGLQVLTSVYDWSGSGQRPWTYWHPWIDHRQGILLFGGVWDRPKLQALVYDILPSTTAVFSYAIGSRKLSANEQFFCWCSDNSKFVTNNSNKTRCVIYSRQQSLHQHKWNHYRLNRDGTLFSPFFFSFFFFTRVGASRVYVRALALGCFYSHISTRSFWRALTVSLDSCAEIKSNFSGVTKSGRVWRKVPESGARSVG